MAWSGLAQLPRIVLYGWVGALREFLRLMCRRRPKPPTGPEHHPTAPTTCTPLDHPAFVRPDPLLYSQSYLAARGLAVTYDNPDIQLFKSGVPVASHELEAGTTYDVVIRVWNNSIDAPAIAMPVHLSFLDFGVGTQRVFVGTVKLDVGVKGSSSQPAFATIPWTTPATPGHFCLLAELDPADDSDRSNNVGQENTDVRAAQSPALFSFALRNDTERPQRYRFEVDAYRIPALPDCAGGKSDAEATLRSHRRENHPVPAGFTVGIDPPTPSLAPDETATISVAVEPPAGFSGRQTVNVSAFHGQGFAGGVTLTLVKEP
jgi:hypothetical protein